MFLDNLLSIAPYCQMNIVNKVIYFKSLLCNVTVEVNKILQQVRVLKI